MQRFIFISCTCIFVMLSGFERNLSNYLTRLSLSSLLWDIGKQNSPRCDAAERGVPSGTILFAKESLSKNEIKK